MIDHLEITERLLAKLNEALPIPARLTPELQVSLVGENADMKIPARAAVAHISNAGDEGGIVCKLDLGPDVDKAAFTSITHLRFDAVCRWQAPSPPVRSTASIVSSAA